MSGEKDTELAMYDQSSKHVARTVRETGTNPRVQDKVTWIFQLEKVKINTEE